MPRASPKRSEAEHRRTLARTYYGLEAEWRRQDWDADSAFVCIEEYDLCSLTDSRFAFSREDADWKLLTKQGRQSG